MKLDYGKNWVLLSSDNKKHTLYITTHGAWLKLNNHQMFVYYYTEPDYKEWRFKLWRRAVGVGWTVKRRN